MVAKYIYKAHRVTTLGEAIRHLADKGQPVPTELLKQLEVSAAGEASSLHRGIFLVAIGSGMVIAQGTFRSWGMVPLLMGVGYLILWKIEERSADGK